MRRQVKTLLEKRRETSKWTSHRANEVAEYIRVDSPTLWEQPPLDIINTNSGLLQTATGVLKPHCPTFLSTIQINAAYDPSADCPRWSEFVENVFPPDASEFAWEIPGWLMVPMTSHRKAVIFVGEGGNGKSTFLGAVINFLGGSNVSNLTLQKLETDRFAPARLLGRLANICPDLPAKELETCSMFKSLTGGDRITGERKFQDSFEFTPFARLLFSANHLPRSADASNAFFDRWLVIPFERSFREGEQGHTPRAQLNSTLADPRELSGVLNKALTALKRLQERGALRETESMRAAWDEFRQATDPLAVWLDRNAVEHPHAKVLRRRLLQAYNADCERHGRPPLTEQSFGRAIRRLRPAIKEEQRTIEGKSKQWVWLGIGLKSDQEGAAGWSQRTGEGG